MFMSGKSARKQVPIYSNNHQHKGRSDRFRALRSLTPHLAGETDNSHSNLLLWYFPHCLLKHYQSYSQCMQSNEVSLTGVFMCGWIPARLCFPNHHDPIIRKRAAATQRFYWENCTNKLLDRFLHNSLLALQEYKQYQERYVRLLGEIHVISRTVISPTRGVHENHRANPEWDSQKQQYHLK